MSPREDAGTKGARYVAEGRLTVTRVDDHEIAATCKGRGEVWSLGYKRGGWHCSCPVRGACSHLHALWCVTIRPGVR